MASGCRRRINIAETIRAFRCSFLCLQLAVGSFLLTVELFYLQLTCLAFLLTIRAFLLTVLAFLLTIGAFFFYNWESASKKGLKGL